MRPKVSDYYTVCLGRSACCHDRHPDSSSRPDFVSVVQQLSLPDTKLLKWSEEDKATDPEAATLGAGLDKAVDLYMDLQKQYTVHVCNV